MLRSSNPVLSRQDAFTPQHRSTAQPSLRRWACTSHRATSNPTVPGSDPSRRPKAG